MAFLKPELFSNFLYILRIPSTNVLTVHQRHSIEKKTSEEQENGNLRYKISKKFEQIKPF